MCTLLLGAIKEFNKNGTCNTHNNNKKLIRPGMMRMEQVTGINGKIRLTFWRLKTTIEVVPHR